MAKRKKKTQSRAQAWAASRNRAKGQVAFAKGSLASVIKLNVLTKDEQKSILTVMTRLRYILEAWEDQNSDSRQNFLDTWD